MPPSSRRAAKNKPVAPPGRALAHWLAMAPPARLPQVYYLGDAYISHRIAGQSYCQALADLGCLTDDFARADVVVIHHEMRRLTKTVADLPALAGKYKVALLVWETDLLRPEDVPAIREMDEIWTPSLFSARSLVKVHPRVFVLPHVVERPATTQTAAFAAAESTVAQWLGPRGDTFDVLAVAPHSEERKNLHQLRAACLAVARRIPRLRLIIKSPGANSGAKVDQPTLLPTRTELRVLGPISRAAMLALIDRAHLAASAHRAEGWGLTLSDAMARGTLTLATGYSGNLTFMHRGNALLVDCHLEAIGAHADALPFDRKALWAKPWQAHLEDQLVAGFRLLSEGGGAALQQQAVKDTARFGPCRLALLLHARMIEIAARSKTFLSESRTLPRHST